MDRLLPADPLERPAFEGPEELRLDRGRERRDLVQEEGPAVSLFELPGPGGDGPGEGTLFVAKEFRLGETLRKRGAVHGDEGPGAPRAAAVQRLGHQLLSRAALPLQQNRDVRTGHLLDLREEGPHRGARPDDRVERAAADPLVLQGLVLCQDATPLEGSPEDEEKLGLVDRLLEEVVRRRARRPGARASARLRPS